MQDKKVRTNKQNRALHKWFIQLAETLNGSGFDMKSVIKQVDIPWSAYTVKEHLFRPTMKTMLGKDSTTELETHEIDQIFGVISKSIGERTGVFIPFPSIEILMQEQINNEE